MLVLSHTRTVTAWRKPLSDPGCQAAQPSPDLAGLAQDVDLPRVRGSTGTTPARLLCWRF